MIKEIVQFTERLPEKLKTEGLKPKEGLHIMLSMKQEDDTWKMDMENIQWEHYSKKDGEVTDFLESCMQLQINAWMVDTDKCFDLPARAIHSCSPYCVGFKREHLEGGKKFNERATKNKEQLHERTQSYFNKALNFVKTDEDKERLKVFSALFINPDHPLYFLELLKNNELYSKLGEGEYIIFYLNASIEEYRTAHNDYLAQRLFNTDSYNINPNNEEPVFGTSNFYNGFNNKKPFLKHHTATFDITGRISLHEAKVLDKFPEILQSEKLPKPLPIFLFLEELRGEDEKANIQDKFIGLFNKSGNRIGYKEIIEGLWEKYSDKLANYYLLYYQNTKKGIIFYDFDFVVKFEYELKDADGQCWRIQNLFGKTNGYDVSNVFEFQNRVIHKIFNNDLITNYGENNWEYRYFIDFTNKDDNRAKKIRSSIKSDRNFLNILKFRKAIYEFVYKSKRQAITKPMFDEMMTVSILEDIRLDKFENQRHSEYFNISEKLNIWFSLYEKFNNSQPQNSKPMASKLADYQRFVADIANGKEIPENVSLEEYAFAAGQVISYVLSLSESSDKSYQRIEPFLQKVKVDQLNATIAHEIARYKHKIINAKASRFKPVATFVLSFEDEENIKKYLPQLLAGLFADSAFYIKKEESHQLENAEV